MLWLYIFIGVILFLTLIMFIPITVHASYCDEFRCTLFVGFIKVWVYPPKSKKKKTESKADREKQDDKESKEEKQSLIEEKGLVWFINLIKKIAKFAESALKDFFKRILIKRLMISIKIAGNDAADTAIKYGQCCSVVYPAVSIITGTVNCTGYGIDILPDFNEKSKSKIEFELKARIFLFNLALLVFRHGFKGLKLLTDLKNN